MNKTIKTALKFYGISGTGWLIDFVIFTTLTHFGNIPISIANILSSIPSITLIFFVSTKKIFSENNTRFSTGVKYAIYIIYQIILLTLLSLFAQFLYNEIIQSSLNSFYIISEWLELLIKILITPISMIINYLFMRFLVEKL